MDIEKLLEQAKPEIVRSLVDEAKKSLAYDVKWKAQEEIQKTVLEFVKTEIIPEVMKELVESKESLISLGVKVAPFLMDELVKAFTTQVSANLKNSWTRKEVFDRLLH